jgi:DHA2 family multidrug resistance protein
MALAPTSSAPAFVKIPHRGFAAAVIVIANFMVILDMTVANVSVPHIAGSLGVSLSQGTWIITSYAVAEAISVPLTGWLSQRFGPVKLFVGVMTGFAAFSALCGMSVTLEMIVASRIGQGLCGGLLMPLAQTLLMRIFPPEERTKAMLLFTSTVLLGPAMGPIVGGYISDNFSWHWIFLINIPIAIACVSVGYALLRPVELPSRKGPVDLVGLALLVVWIGALQVMLDIGREHDWFDDPKIVILAVTAVVGFCAFLIWELTEKHPIVNVRIFRHRGFTMGVLALALCFGGYFASIVLIPQWLQTSMGYPAMLAGFVTACTALTALTTGKLVATLVTKVDARVLVSGGVAWLGCMAILRSNWTTGADFWTLAAPQLIQGFAMTFFMLPLTTISLASVLPEETASAAGLQNFVRTISVAVATALALTAMDDTTQAARSEIAANLQPDATMGTLANAGFTDEQSIGIIANFADREALMIGVDHVFILTAVVFFLSALVVWLAPRPEKPKG